MLHFPPSELLRDQNGRNFDHSQPPKPSISFEKVVVFQVFPLFYFYGLLDHSSRLLWSIWNSSGWLRGSSFDHFSLPNRSKKLRDPPASCVCKWPWAYVGGRAAPHATSPAFLTTSGPKLKEYCPLAATKTTFRSRWSSFFRFSHFSTLLASWTNLRGFLGRFGGPLGGSG